MTNKQNMSNARHKEVENIYNIFNKINHRTLNINGFWGCGKTYVSKLVENKINLINEFTVLRINLSDYDYCNDPLIPFLAVILGYINDSDFDPDNKIKLRKIAADILNIIGGLSYIIDQSGTTNKLFNFITDKIPGNENNSNTYKNNIECNLSEIKTYKKALYELETLINEYCKYLNKSKLIVFVDDFDRTNPLFSFRVLNIIYQLKKIAMLQVVTIMNREQFENQLSHIYGYSSHDENYLTKYIDLEIMIQNPCHDHESIKDFLQELNIKYDKDAIFIYDWLAKISVRELIKFGKLYDYVSKFFSDSNRSNYYAWFEKENHAYLQAILLAIILIKFDSSFISNYFNLLTNDKKEQLEKNIYLFTTDLIKNINYQYGNKERANEIITIVKNFLSTELDNAPHNKKELKYFYNALMEEILEN